MDFIAPMLVLIVGALTIGSILRTQIVNRRLRENTRAWADVQTRLIDKFGSADEVVRYLEGDAGRRLLDGQTNGSGSPHARILDSIHTGLLVLLGGIGLVAAGVVGHDEVRELVQILGMIAMILGVGFLASAGVSWFLLGKWGLLPKRDEHDSTSENG